MRMWSQNLISVIHFFTSSNLLLTLDDSCCERPEDMDNIIRRNDAGVISGLNFPEKLIIIANHQIYADWMYIWFVAYLARAHGAIKILLKHSLKYLPFYGQRKIAQDQRNIVHNLERRKKLNRPLWLVLFPEGTVISKNARERSQAYAEKNHLRDNRFTLLPRSTGMHLCLKTLDDGIDWIYDLTIGYPGVMPNDIPEEVLTLGKIFGQGKGPKDIHVYVRRYAVETVPKESEAFSQWIYERWKEKDDMMTHFYEHGRFPNFNQATQRERNNFKVPMQLQHPVIDCLKLWLCLLPYVPLVYLAKLTYTYLYL
ncbi:uncharacterized protein BYT42DRAFT_593563 [Radiomyces spectabilis]|uniref:uncharacterized protein n=1 Tax=Radiomyces spectabilis TaxID=64574 RepID=UPI00221F73B5|nr:uncharacterized protein BYT42DRAFT_593563 [Radiomyces spectabilis]KAI8379485.1 hypothetical protein BYT42DRAFT_593563 [Radiomyces spectabilis]